LNSQRNNKQWEVWVILLETIQEVSHTLRNTVGMRESQGDVTVGVEAKAKNAAQDLKLWTEIIRRSTSG